MTTLPEFSGHSPYPPFHLFAASGKSKLLRRPGLVAFPQTHKERMQRWHYRLERLFAQQTY